MTESKNYPCVEADKLTLRSAQWDDLRVVPGAFKFAGTADPGLIDWTPGGSGTAFKMYAFKKNDGVFASCQMPHSYKEGSDLRFHLHWTPHSRGSTEHGAKVGWKVDYTIANIYGTFASASTAILTGTVTGTDHYHELAEATAHISGTGLTISHMIQLKIYRSDTGSDDTWAGTTNATSPAILEFDIHFEKDTMGSRQELIK